ncbi:MAG: 3-oxoacyl-[acyl-carrier protein] reductase [Frankiales bacterium]|nr:3-oxoacyl-[acyl-carrier protein] reductase [Frankiales bacterium]
MSNGERTSRGAPDKYRDLMNTSIGRTVSARIGLPRPALLRRFRAGDALLPGPLLLGGNGLTGLAQALTAAGAEVVTGEAAGARGEHPPSADRLGALVYDASELDGVAGLAAIREFLAGSLRRLSSSGRVLIIGREPDGTDHGWDAARQALDGIVRSLGKELRAGATANLVSLAGTPSSDALQSLARFLLSGRAAYVDGQTLRVAAVAVDAPADWATPLIGRVAVVTGAARGIGAAIAEVLARDGAKVIAADLPAAGEALAKVANRINGTALQLDVTDESAAGTLIRYAGERFGGLDVVVHNAGITRDKLMANMKAESWDPVLAVNLQSQVQFNAELLRTDGLRPGGRIICLASTTGLAGNRGQTNYGASKAGIIGMVRSMAPPFHGRGITINAVAPGFIDTAMTHRMPLASREVARRINSLQQAGLPVDVAETVGWLAWPGSAGISGQTVRVCGQNWLGA